MKQALRLVAPILLLTAIPVLLLTLGGCFKEYNSSQIVQEGSQVIYPLGIDLNTLEGNTWVYHDMNPEGKSYAVQVKNIQNGFAQFVKPDADAKYIGINSFGFEQLGYNANGDLIGRTGNTEQTIFPKDGGSFSFTMAGGLFSGELVLVTRISEELYQIKIGNRTLQLERGIGITKVNAPFGPGNIYGDYELESTMPDPPIHFGE